MGYRVSEEYRPDYQNIRLVAPRYADVSGTLKDLAKQTAEEGRVQAAINREMYSAPVEAFFGQMDKAKARQQAEEAIASQREARGLAQLQKRKAEQEIALAEEFARPEREAQLAATRDAMENARIERQLAQEKMDVLQEELPTGRTVLQESILAPIEQQKRAADLSERQMNIAERNAQANAETAKLQQTMAKLNIDNIERQNRVQMLQGQIAAEPDPARRAALIDNLKQTATADEIGQAVANIRSGEIQSEMMQRMLLQSNTQEQNRIARSVEGQQFIQKANAAAAELEDAIKNLEQASPLSNEATSAAQRIEQIMRDFGYTSEAEAMAKGWQINPSDILPGGKPLIQSRTDTAKEVRSRFYRRLAGQVEANYSDLDSLRNAAQSYRQRSFNMADRLQNGNIFQQSSQAQLPQIPQVYDPLQSRQQQVGAAQAQPQFEKDAQGNIRLRQPQQQGAVPGQPNAFPWMQILQQGKQREQVGAR